MPSRRGVLLGDEEAAMMEAHPEINWSAVFRQAIREKVEALELAEQLREERDTRAQSVAGALKAGIGEQWRRALDGSGSRAKAARRR